LREFHQFYSFGAHGDKDELIRFWGQKVKGQGHSQTIYGQNSTFGPLCHHRTSDGDSCKSFGCIVSGSAIFGKMSSKGQKWRPNMLCHVYL